MDTLTSGASLTDGQQLTSPNGKYTLTLANGNLELAGPGGPVWATNTAGSGAVRADMQADGNLVLYTDSNGVVWASNTGDPDSTLVLQDDRNIVVYAPGHKPVWSPNTFLTEDELAAEKAAEEAAAAAAAPPPPAPPPPAAPRTYVVVPGDTLSGIAEQFYGDAGRYPQIAQANGIDNPDLIQPGQELVIPD
ncbi:LysM peptidoglycan-binding domain-containing protein [Pseudonocardia acidicola]|uniref:LysM peptidoglycan-binding domain-containing protein n=1 Tax=Pseudonocardia acidicola TaxID=2724939 RepID=UPI001B7CFB8A